MDEAAAPPGKRPEKSPARSAGLLAAIVAVLFIAGVGLLAAGVHSWRHRPFPAGEWKALREANYRGRKLESMAKLLERRSALIGMTEKELFELLGPSDWHDGVGGRVRDVEWCVSELRYLMSIVVLHVELDEKGRVSRAEVWAKNV